MGGFLFRLCTIVMTPVVRVKLKYYFGGYSLTVIRKNPSLMTKSRLIAALAIILFLSSCNRYITTYEAASRHNKCGKYIR
jgi:hypothetical protein